MNGRSWTTLAGIAVVVAVLALWRGGGDGAPEGGGAAPGGATELPAILDFGRDTCVPCKKMMPVLDALRDAYAGVVDVRYYDLREPANAEYAKDFQVKL